MLIFSMVIEYNIIDQKLNLNGNIIVGTHNIMSISNIKCEICMTNYNQKFYCPRICIKCGNTICEKCMVDIKHQQANYKCPYCKNLTNEYWPKNLPLLNMMEVQGKANVCQPHKRKAISLCTSPQCNISASICDMADCSKIHKQRGTNNIPVSLITQSTHETQAQQKLTLKMLDLMYAGLESEVINLLRKRKQQSIKTYLSNDQHAVEFSEQANSIIKMINNCQVNKISSKQLNLLKKQLLDQQAEEQAQLISRNRKIVLKEKQIISKAFVELVTKYEAILIPKLYEQQQVKPKISNKSIELPTSPQFDLAKTHLKRNFQAIELFNSNLHSKLILKSRLAGQQNLFVKVELIDGTIFGMYINRKYPQISHEDLLVVDPKSFAYWLNQKKIFLAAANSTSQFDISPDYLFSAANTYNWDGFWFKKDFSKVNAQYNSAEIRSAQFENFRIPLKTKEVKVFQVFQLQFE